MASSDGNAGRHLPKTNGARRHGAGVRNESVGRDPGEAGISRTNGTSGHGSNAPSARNSRHRRGDCSASVDSRLGSRRIGPAVPCSLCPSDQDGGSPKGTSRQWTPFARPSPIRKQSSKRGCARHGNPLAARFLDSRKNASTRFVEDRAEPFERGSRHPAEGSSSRKSSFHRSRKASQRRRSPATSPKRKFRPCRSDFPSASLVAAQATRPDRRPPAKSLRYRPRVRYARPQQHHFEKRSTMPIVFGHVLASASAATIRAIYS